MSSSQSAVTPLVLLLLVLINMLFVRPAIIKPKQSRAETDQKCGEQKCDITGPLFDSEISKSGTVLQTRVYYDVVIHQRCVPIDQDDGNATPIRLTTQQSNWYQGIGRQIMIHWKSTLPPGIKAGYPVEAPEIFFHGQATDPYIDLERDGYLHDSQRNDGMTFRSLWTVAITDYNAHIWETFGFTDRIPWQYLVVLKLRNTPGHPESIVEWNQWMQSGTNLPERLQKEPRIIGRMLVNNYWPDAYIFTKNAQQEGHSPLDIIRVYRYHYLDQSLYVQESVYE